MKEYLQDIVKCVRCGRCRTACPTQKVLGWESSGARGRMQMALGLTSGLEPSEGLVKSIMTCTTCQQCVHECPSGADPLKVTQAIRSKLVTLGKTVSHQEVIQDRIKRSGNSLGDDLSRTLWLSEPLVSQRSEYVYFTGCLASYRQQATAAATYEILKRFGVPLLSDEHCCGSPLVRLGLDAFDVIKHNTGQIQLTGAHTVIAGCAGCYSMLKENYTGFNVIHLSELLIDRLDRIPLGGLDISVTYHDPCHLGRSYGIYDAPRKIIETICDFIEMNNAKEKAHCCGGGGGVRLGYPELSESITMNLINNIPQNVDYVVTSCPLCFRNLSDAGIKVLDIADLVWMSL
jgi:fumarate reductase (CoM/CoB) subunit B